MSDPITISVRDLTAEHEGWMRRSGAVMDRVLPMDTFGRRAILLRSEDTSRWEMRLDDEIIIIAPPPPPDPWEGVTQWVVIFPSGHCTQYGNEEDARRDVATSVKGSGALLIRVSANGAEVVE